MNAKILFPLDLGEVITETDPNLVNGHLRKGWVLLLVYACLDGVGGSYGVYVLGKRRVGSSTVNPDPEGFDQRNG